MQLEIFSRSHPRASRFKSEPNSTKMPEQGFPQKGSTDIGLDLEEGDAHQLSTLKGYAQHFFLQILGLLGFGIIEFEIGTGIANDKDEFASSDFDVGNSLGFQFGIEVLLPAKSRLRSGLVRSAGPLP